MTPDIVWDIRIAVLDELENVLTFLDNSAPKSLHFFNDVLTNYIKGDSEKYEFEVSAKHEDSKYIKNGYKLAFSFNGEDHSLTIVITDRDEYTIRGTAYGLPLELRNENVGAYKSPRAMSFVEYLTIFDHEKVITLGINEVSSKKISYEWTGNDESELSRLYSLANVFDAEIKWRLQLNDDHSTSRLYMDVLKAHSVDYQGIGTDRTDEILRFGKNVSGVRYKEDTANLKTAIRPVGSNGLRMTNVKIEEYDEDGNLLYFSSIGSSIIYAPQARERFPSNLAGNSDGYSTLIDWSYDTDNPNVLAGQGLAKLKEISAPVTEIEVDSSVMAKAGDTFTVQNDAYVPQLIFEARVQEIGVSISEREVKNTVFGNYRIFESEIDQNIVKKMNEIIDQNKPETSRIEASGPTLMNNSPVDVTLINRIFRDGAELDVSGTERVYTWSIKQYNTVGQLVTTLSKNGKSIEILASEWAENARSIGVSVGSEVLSE